MLVGFLHEGKFLLNLRMEECNVQLIDVSKMAFQAPRVA